MWRDRADGRHPSARCHGEPDGSPERLVSALLRRHRGQGHTVHETPDECEGPGARTAVTENGAGTSDAGTCWPHTPMPHPGSSDDCLDCPPL
jgi:hypothetical protein